MQISVDNPDELWLNIACTANNDELWEKLMEDKKRSKVVTAAWIGVVLVVLAETAYLYCYFCYRTEMIKLAERVFNQPLIAVSVVAVVTLAVLVKLIKVIIRKSANN